MIVNNSANSLSKSSHRIIALALARVKSLFQAVLEQHVTLSDTQAKMFEREKDGKKICWNFRKGRCYKGHNCPLFHDGDLKKMKADETSRTQIRMANRGPSDRDIQRMQAQDKEREGTYSVHVHPVYVQ